jgi:hypothetical protein
MVPALFWTPLDNKVLRRVGAEGLGAPPAGKRFRSVSTGSWFNVGREHELPGRGTD